MMKYSGFGQWHNYNSIQITIKASLSFPLKQKKLLGDNQKIMKWKKYTVFAGRHVEVWNVPCHIKTVSTVVIASMTRSWRALPFFSSLHPHPLSSLSLLCLAFQKKPASLFSFFFLFSPPGFPRGGKGPFAPVRNRLECGWGHRKVNAWYPQAVSYATRENEIVKQIGLSPPLRLSPKTHPKTLFLHHILLYIPGKKKIKIFFSFLTYLPYKFLKH